MASFSRWTLTSNGQEEEEEEVVISILGDSVSRFALFVFSAVRRMDGGAAAAAGGDKQVDDDDDVEDRE